jgi:hypothetical protein
VDVECTYNLLMEKSPEKLRANPCFSVFKNPTIYHQRRLEVTFHPAAAAGLLMLISGGGAVYPCHVPPRRCAGSHGRPAR